MQDMQEGAYPKKKKVLLAPSGAGHGQVWGITSLHPVLANSFRHFQKRNPTPWRLEGPSRRETLIQYNKAKESDSSVYKPALVVRDDQATIEESINVCARLESINMVAHTFGVVHRFAGLVRRFSSPKNLSEEVPQVQFTGSQVQVRREYSRACTNLWILFIGKLTHRSKLGTSSILTVKELHGIVDMFRICSDDDDSQLISTWSARSSGYQCGYYSKQGLRTRTVCCTVS